MDSSDFFTQPTHSKESSHFERLNESGFNTLYSFEREGKRFVAKALRSEYRGNLMYEALLRKEFGIGYSLEHLHICHTYSFEEFEELGNAVVMEWLDGRTLDRYIAEGDHSVEELHRVICQLCDALSYAHKRQVIHRDLKPRNIIITYNGDNVKLLDFGLSDTDSHTAFKEPAGSRKYASPELQRGDEVDYRSDIYSLGIVVDELFEGRKSRHIAKVVARATSYYPASRYSDAQAVAAAIVGRRARIAYPILVALVALAMLVAYLFYALNQASESLVPSAQVDRVSVEEFEYRQALSNDYYRHINDSYLKLLNEGIYKIDCSTPEMPNFEKLSREQISLCNRALDSIMGSIKSSSLYTLAQRNITSHNGELIAIGNRAFPATFWINSERQYRQAKDSLALSLKQFPAPKIIPNYAELSYAEQQRALSQYREQEHNYKVATVRRWAIAYRQSHNLSPLPQELIDYRE